MTNAYKKLSGLPFEDMGRKETRLRLDREAQIAQSAATAGPRQNKKRSEPLGTDGRGRRYWALKADPNFVFTQVNYIFTFTWVLSRLSFALLTLSLPICVD